MSEKEKETIILRQTREEVLQMLRRDPVVYARFLKLTG